MARSTTPSSGGGSSRRRCSTIAKTPFAGLASAGGLSIGLLPETDIKNANPYVTIPIATGIGEARNVLVARAGICIVAIGDSYGTLSEVALGLQFGRPVIGLRGAAQVAGVRHLDGVEAAVDAIAAIALRLPT